MVNRIPTIKAITDDKVIVAGYGVVWGDRDLYGQTFTPQTDLKSKFYPNPPLYYDHTLTGVEEEVGLTVKMAPDELGLWVEHELDVHAEYMEGILKLIEAGALGYSSGSAWHLTRYDGDIIKQWPIIEFSLTPTPAEPRTLGVERLKAIAQAHPELKALLLKTPSEGVASGVTAEPAPTKPTTNGGAIMAEEVKTAPVEQKPIDMEEFAKLAAKAAVEAYKKELENEPPEKKGAATVPAEVRDPKDFGPFKSLGEQLLAIKASAKPGGQIDERLYKVKATGLNEGVGSEGGFLVQQDFTADIMRRAYEQGQILSRVRRIPVGPNANGLKVKVIDETSRATGSRWGGVQVYFAAEAGLINATEIKFRLAEWSLKKIVGAYYATGELMQDSVGLGNVVDQAFSEEFTWTLENEIIRGAGGNHFNGVLNSGALVTVAKEAGQLADTFTFQNVVDMWTRMWARSRANAVWLINQDVEPQLFTMSLPIGVGGVPVYLPPTGASGSPYGTLMGRPVIPVEQADTVGDVGDVMLVDLSQYVMIEKGGLQAASSIHVMFMYDEEVFRFITRADGGSFWNSALTPALSSNTLSPFVVLAARA